MPEFDRSRFSAKVFSLSEDQKGQTTLSVTRSSVHLIRSENIAVQPISRTKNGSNESNAYYSRLAQVSVRLRKEWFVLNLHQRITATVLLLLLVTSALIQIIQPVVTSNQYKLSLAAYKIVGQSRDDTNKYLTLNSEKSAYQFSLPDSASSPDEHHGGRNSSLYSTLLPVDASKGIVYTDSATKIGIVITPQFDTAPGQKISGDSIVYPTGGQQLVYTHKYNGLKEDIIVPRYQGDRLHYNFALDLPPGVEARIGSGGDIGIYSADPSLFGDISFGSDKDRANIDKARQNAVKSNLVGTIPSPIVKDANGKEYGALAHFDLSKKMSGSGAHTSYQLSVAATVSRHLSYPISVDPTIQTGTSSDFLSGDATGVDVDQTSGLIRRSALTGGVTVSQASGTFDATGRQAAGVAVARGYIYEVGGATNGATNVATVRYAPIDSAGVIGTWNNGLSLSSARGGGCVVSLDGYLYAIGGTNGSNAGTGTVEYTAVNADGTLKGWTTSSQNVSGSYLYSMGCTTYNNKIYVAGGFNGATVSNTEYSGINGNGDLSGWIGASGLTTIRNSPGVTAYNGVLYVAGGHSNSAGSTFGTTDILTSIESAKINADGSLGAFSVIANMTTKRFSPVVVSTGGYIYFTTGCSAVTLGSCSTYDATVDYSTIYADGSISAPVTTNNFVTTARALASGAALNGNLYVVGGCTNLTSTTLSCAAVQTDTRRATLDVAGRSTAFSAGNSLTTAVAYAGNVATNGYVYVIGGCTTASSDNTTCTNPAATVSYASVSATGVLSWATTTAIPEARYGVSVASYNGFIYVTGGCATAACTSRATTYYGQVSSTGTVPSWSTATASLGLARNGSSPMVAYDGYLYLLGGRSATSYTTRTDSAPISANGDISAWTQQTALPANNGFEPVALSGKYVYASLDDSTYRYATLSAGTISSWTTITNNGGISTANIFVDRGYLYYAGGGTLRHAVINADGSLGTITTDSSMATARSFYGTSVVNGYLIVVAGCTNVTNFGTGTCASRTNNTEVSKLNNGGSGIARAWTTSAQSINARSSHRVLALNGYIYVLGGACTGIINGCASSISGQVQYAAVNASTGDVGTWAAATNGITPRNNFSAFSYNGRLYVLGGCSNSTCTTYTRTIQYATPAANGDITSAWTTNAANLPADDVGTSMIGYKGYVYRVAGNVNAAGSTTTTEFTTIGVNGSIGGSWTSGSSLVTATTSNRLLINNGYLYTLGGINGTTEINDVEFAQIQTDHSLGGWNITTAINGARQAAGVAVLNGYIYAIGGYRSGSNRLSDTQMAYFLPDGQISAWQQTNSLNIAKADAESVVIGGRVYIPGGSDNTGTALADVEYTSINSIARLGTYSRLIDFNKGVLPTKLITRGVQQTDTSVNLSYNTSDAATTTLGTPQSMTNIAADGSVALAIPLLTGVSQAQYFYLSYGIDDTTTASFPEASTTPSTITDYDLYFTPNPALRLRGGQTFTNQAVRGLEASPQ
jgi:hypothetical protein